VFPYSNCPTLGQGGSFNSRKNHHRKRVGRFRSGEDQAPTLQNVKKKSPYRRLENFYAEPSGKIPDDRTRHNIISRQRTRKGRTLLRAVGFAHGKLS